MIRLIEHIQFLSGTPQFRIREVADEQAPNYQVFGQRDLLDDLSGVQSVDSESKVIRTNDMVTTLFSKDIVFSLISGTACIVSKQHEGYLYTQNYIKLFADASISPKFLIYLLNEDVSVRKQFQTGMQGSATMKYTLKQLKELVLPVLPSVEKQEMIGNIYLKQLKLEMLKCRVARAETTSLLHSLEEVMQSERNAV